MTQVDERVDQPVAEPKRPRFVFLLAFGTLAVILLLAGLGGNSFQSKSQNVQKNEAGSLRLGDGPVHPFVHLGHWRSFRDPVSRTVSGSPDIARRGFHADHP